MALTAADPVARWAAYVVAHRTGLVADKTSSTEDYHLTHGLPAILGTVPLGDLTPLMVEDAAAVMLRKGRSRQTVRRSLSVLSVICARAVREQAIPTNPCTGLRVPPGTGRPPRPINPYTYDQLHNVVARQRHYTHWADLTLVLGLTGLRWSEARELRASDFQDGRVPALRITRARPDGQSVKTPKNGRPRMVPLVPEAAEIIAARTQACRNPDSLIFPTRAATSILGPNFRRATHWNQTAPGHRIHDLRHTAATLWLGAGLDVKTVQTWLGHADGRLTLDLYGHWRGLDADAAALDRLTRALSGQSDPGRR